MSTRPGDFMKRAIFRLANCGAVSIAFLACAWTPVVGSAQEVRGETVTKGLDHPWAVAFLPQGRFLVTERPGRLRVVAADGKIQPPVAGLPQVAAGGQGGL